jgi:hypothetical protein
MGNLIFPSRTIFKQFCRLLLVMVLLSFGHQDTFGQTGTPCSTCSENRHNCYLNADRAYQDCRNSGGDESQCENSHQAALQNCDSTYEFCSATCDPGGVNPTPQTTCRDNGYGALTNLESNGYVSGWAIDGDAPTYNETIQVIFYIDRTVNLNTAPDAGGQASLRRPPGSGHGFSVVLPARYRDGKTHTIYGYTSDPCFGIRHFWQGSPRTFVLTPGNPIDDHRTFVRQLYIDYYRREPDQAGWDQWTNVITACGTNTSCANQKRGYVAASFFHSNEYATWGAVPELTWLQKGTDAYDEAFVRALYRTMLRRDATAITQTEINSWVGVLNSWGSPTPQAGYNAVASSFIQSSEYRRRFYY